MGAGSGKPPSVTRFGNLRIPELRRQITADFRNSHTIFAGYRIGERYGKFWFGGGFLEEISDYFPAGRIASIRARTTAAVASGDCFACFEKYVPAATGCGH